MLFRLGELLGKRLVLGHELRPRLVDGAQRARRREALPLPQDRVRVADGDAQQVVDRRLVLEQVGLRREEPREPVWKSNFGRVVPVTASARQRSG